MSTQMRTMILMPHEPRSLPMGCSGMNHVTATVTVILLAPVFLSFSSLLIENPVYRGWSNQSTLANLVKLLGFESSIVELLTGMKGPLPLRKLRPTEEQPGPLWAIDRQQKGCTRTTDDSQLMAASKQAAHTLAAPAPALPLATILLCVASGEPHSPRWGWGVGGGQAGRLTISETASGLSHSGSSHVLTKGPGAPLQQHPPPPPQQPCIHPAWPGVIRVALLAVRGQQGRPPPSAHSTQPASNAANCHARTHERTQNATHPFIQKMIGALLGSVSASPNT